MRLVVQRVTRASVTSDGATLGEIGPGAVVLVGIAAGDTARTVERMAAKIVTTRFFRDADGRTNLDILASGGAYLVVSQFTLMAELRGGRRPGFTHAADPALAAELVDAFADALARRGPSVQRGRFGADMQVELVNDGPFTLVIDSERDLVLE